MNPELEIWLIYLQEKLSICMRTLKENLSVQVTEKLFSLANTRGNLWAKSLSILTNVKKYSDPEMGSITLYEDAVLASNQDENILSYCNILQSFAVQVPPNSLPVSPNLFENYSNLLIKVVGIRSLIKNHFKRAKINEMEDRKIIGNAMIVINEILTKQKQNDFLLWNE